MENSVRNSDVPEISKKSRSLDLKTLYVEKSDVSKEQTEGRALNRKRRSLPENKEFGSDSGKKRRKGRKEVSLSSLESGSRKNGKFLNASDGSKIHGLILNQRDSTKKQNDRVSRGANLKSSSSDVTPNLDSNVTPIPKRPRDFSRRKKFQNTDVPNQSGISRKVSSDAQMVKLTGYPVTPTIYSEGKRKNVFDEFKENSSDRANSTRGSKAKDGTKCYPILKRMRRDHGKSEEAGPQEQTHRLEIEPVVDNFSETFEEFKDNDEENLEENAARMLSSRFDPSCTVFPGSVTAPVSKSMNGFSFVSSFHGDSESHLLSHSAGSESNSADAACRVLRPRKKGKEKRQVRKRRHFYEIFSRNIDAHWVLNRRIKVFWPLDQCWYFGLVTGYDPHEKLHHVKYDDREEEWIDLQNERFKLLLLPSEVPHKPDIEKSGSEFVEEKGDMKVEDDNCVGSFMDSEPIISWLARSSHRVKSSPLCVLKKQKTPSLSNNLSPPISSEDSVGKLQSCLVDGSSRPITNKNYSNVIVQERSSGGEMAEKSMMESVTCSGDRRLHSVYFRKRLRRRSQALDFASQNSGCESFVGSVQFCVSVVDRGRDLKKYDVARQSSSLKDWSQLDQDGVLWSVENIRSFKSTMPQVDSKILKLKLSIPFQWLDLTFGADNFSVYGTLFPLQKGMVMVLWPMVQLEMLFVDNVVGLRFMLFEGCLMQAVAFVCLVLVAFYQPSGDREFVDQQLPVTSIRFELTGLQNLGRRLVFVFYSFLDIKNSKWLYLDGKLKQHCSVSKQLPLPECTYDNIKLLQSRSTQLSVTSAYGKPVSLKALRKRSRHGIMHMGNTKESANANIGISASNFDEQPKRLPQFVLSFAAAPTFFLSLHLKLLMARNVASISFHNPISLVESPEESLRLIDEDCSLAEHCYDRETFDEDMGCSTSQAISGSGLSSFAESKVEADTVSMIDDGDLIKSQKCLNGKLNVAETSIDPQDSGKNENTGIVKQQRHPCHLSGSEQCVGVSHSSFPVDHSSQEKSETRCFPQSHDISVQIPQINGVESHLFDGETVTTQHSSDFAWNPNDCTIRSPNPTAPRSIWHRNRHNSGSSSFGYRSKMWPDGQADVNHNGLFNGSRKPRSQVSYFLPFGGYDFSSKPRSHHRKGRPYKRFRNDSEKLMLEGPRRPQQPTELLSCDANILITARDRGWRECGAQVVLECIDRNDWRLMVKLLGATKYSYKACQFLQPGTTNRYTHAMMWKGGKDWILEFPDRSQWTLFKEMHEECYNRNIRAASVKTIPIPGVRLIEESDDNAVEVPFARSSPKYIRQGGTEVDMALNPSCVLYDMDSDDEEWISKCRTSGIGTSLEISEDMFERTMDMFEKAAYAQQRDDFTGDEIEESMIGVGSIDAVKEIYEYWKQKRLKKRMPLIRQFQPPLWERYQLLVKEWEIAVNKIQSLPNGYKEKTLLVEKPPMFAFCLRPRGLEVPNKGSKQRSHRKLTVGAHSYALSRDPEGLQFSGRKSNGFTYGEERIPTGQSHESLYASPWMTSTRALSPRDAVSAGYLSMSSDGSERSQQLKLRRDKSKKMGTFTSSDSPMMATSYNQRTGKRNGICRWNVGQSEWPGQKQYQQEQRHRIEQLGGSDLDEFRLRDASSAAQHASNMAKLKREKAQRLLYRADVAMHKAMVAVMTAEAIKASSEDPDYDRYTLMDLR